MEEERRSSAIDVGSLQKSLFHGPAGINVLNLVPGNSPKFRKRSKSSGHVLEKKSLSIPTSDESQTFLIQNGDSCDKGLKISVSESNLVTSKNENEPRDGEVLTSICKRRVRRKGARPPSRAFVKSLCLLDSEADLLQESLNELIIEKKGPIDVPDIKITSCNDNAKNSSDIIANDKIENDNSPLIENQQTVSKHENVDIKVKTNEKDTKLKDKVSIKDKPIEKQNGCDEYSAKDVKESSLQKAKNLLQGSGTYKPKARRLTDDLYMSKASLRRKCDNKELSESPNILRQVTSETSNKNATESSKRKVSANLSTEGSISSRLRDRFKPKPAVDLKEPSSPRFNGSKSPTLSRLTPSTSSPSRGSPRLTGRMFGRSKK